MGSTTGVGLVYSDAESMKVEPDYMHSRFEELRSASAAQLQKNLQMFLVRVMSDGPNASAKWSKYSVEDGKLVRKAEFCPQCGPEYSLPYTQTASHAVAVVTLLH